MSDSNFAAVSRYRGFLEVIDAEWMADSLSDDELDVPTATDLLIEEEDDNGENGPNAAGGGGGKAASREDRWTDLGLDVLQPE